MSDRLRLLIVTRSLPFHSLGGMEAVVWDLARAFARSGSFVTVLTTSCPTLPEHSDVDGVHIHCLNVPSGRYSQAWWKHSADAYAATYSNSVDVVLSVSAGAMSMATRRSGTAPIFVVQSHGTAWGEFVSKIRQATPLALLKSSRNLIAMFKDTGYRKFDAFVAIGDAVNRDLVRPPTRWIIGNLPIHLIPNGVEPKQFAFDLDSREKIRKQFGIEPSEKLVFSASRLHPQKGIMEGLEGFALAMRQHPQMRYLIAGSGPDERRLKDRVLELKIDDKVHFLGSIAREDLGAYLSAADLFLFTTKRVEGLPTNVLEALATGLPVIVSSHISDPQLSTISVNPRDASAIALAISETPVSECRSSKLPETFTLTCSARCYLNLFESIRSKNAV